jgi:hypothetical protein
VSEREIKRTEASYKCSNAASGCSIFPQSQSRKPEVQHLNRIAAA